MPLTTDVAELRWSVALLSRSYPEAKVRYDRNAFPGTEISS